MTATRYMLFAPRHGRLALIWLFVVLASLIAPVALRASEEKPENVTYHRSPPAPKGQPGDTVESLSHRMAGVDRQIDRFRILNGLDARGTVKARDRVKIVTE